jgi:hypothetical protein
MKEEESQKYKFQGKKGKHFNIWNSGKNFTSIPNFTSSTINNARLDSHPKTGIDNENTNMVVAKNIYNFVQNDIHIPLHQFEESLPKDDFIDTEGGTKQFVFSDIQI